MQYRIPVLENYNISERLGFLSASAPISSLPPYYKPWDDIAPCLSSLLHNGTIRTAIDQLPLLTGSQLRSREELHRAFVILGFLVHAYVWCDGAEKPEPNIPVGLSEPYLEVCKKLGVKETLTYAGLCLWNWRVKGERTGDQSIECLENLEKLECFLNFTGTRDEEVFYLVPVAVEAEGGELPKLLMNAMEAAAEETGTEKVIFALTETAAALRRMGRLMKLLYEQCDPKVFFHQLRPFLPGAKGMDARMADGWLFHKSDGTTVSAKHVGGSAAQSSLFPFLDLVLGVEHKPMGGAGGETVFEEMRAYMPAEHRQFLEDVAKLPSLRTFVEQRLGDDKLVNVYNQCLHQLAAWRSKHIGVIMTHIVSPSRGSKSLAERAQAESVNEGPSVKDESQLQGTGGSALIPFLKQSRNETIEASK